MQTLVSMNEVEMQVMQIALALLKETAPSVIMNERENRYYEQTIHGLIHKLEESEENQYPIVEHQ